MEITSTSVANSHVQPVQKTSLCTSHKPPSMCPACGAGHHQGGRQNCLAYHAIRRNCSKTGHFVRVCCSHRRQHGAPTQGVTAPTTSALNLDPVVFCTVIESASTIVIQMSSLNGLTTVLTLPDSGAEISIAGQSLLQSLNKHPDNLVPSTISP